MTLCCCCAGPIEASSTGLSIRPVQFIKSKKSGRLITRGEHFPDGATEKLVCDSCVANIAESVGLFEQGFDFPMEIAPPLEPDDIIGG